MKAPSIRTLLPLAALLLSAAACSDDDPVGPDEAPAALLHVVPAGGATDVDRHGPVVVEFDHAIMSGMQAYAALHLGDVDGPVVAGAWSRSDDGTRLVFTPAAPLEPHTRYTLHLGGGMMDASGRPVDMGTYGPGMGGGWANGGMMGGPMGGGPHMGDGWRHPQTGGWGMVFSFTTGA